MVHRWCKFFVIWRRHRCTRSVWIVLQRFLSTASSRLFPRSFGRIKPNSSKPCRLTCQPPNPFSSFLFLQFVYLNTFSLFFVHNLVDIKIKRNKCLQAAVQRKVSRSLLVSSNVFFQFGSVQVAQQRQKNRPME